jgi:N-acetylmuramoyl-L-alanine amidase
MLSRLLLSACLALTLLAGGAGRVLAAAAAPAPRLAYRPARPEPQDDDPALTPKPLAEVVKTWQLALASQPRENRVELSGEGVRLVLVPGLPLARVNRRTVKLPAAPVYRDGELIVPAACLALLPRPRPAAPAPASRTVVILDPGHGGRDPGAVGAYGIREKDVVLRVGLFLRRELGRRGVRVRMTRDDDSYPTLAQRADLANRTPNSLFVSIHANAARDRSARGVETFVLSGRVSDRYRARRADRYRLPGDGARSAAERRRLRDAAARAARDESEGLAGCLQRQLVAASGDENRGVKRKNLHVLRESYFSPAVLVELGFLSHAPSARRLRTEAYQRRLAACLAEGILAYLDRHANGRETAWARLLGRPEAN